MARFIIGQTPSLLGVRESGDSQLTRLGIIAQSSTVSNVRNLITGRSSIGNVFSRDNLNRESDNLINLLGVGNKAEPKYYNSYNKPSNNYVALRRKIVEEVIQPQPVNYNDIVPNDEILGSEGFQVNENLIFETPQATRVETVQEFVDHNALVTLTRKKDIIITKVQGRDFSRKEYVGAGDYMINITGRVCSHRPDIYPEEEVAKLISMINHDDVIQIEHQLLNRFNINGIIVLDYKLTEVSGMSNIQNYSINAIFERPLEILEAERVREQDNIQNILSRINESINLDLSLQNTFSTVVDQVTS